MSQLRDRREFLRLGLGAAAAVASAGAAGFARTAAAQQFATKSLNVRQLRDSLYQLEGAASNMLLFDHRAARLMVDSGAADNGAELALIISQRLGGAPVGVLLNTHWHPEHTGGNDMLGRGGAKIIAHETTRLWMGTEYYVDWQDKTYEPRADIALPNDTFYSSDPQPIAIDIGDERIEYGHLREAHTDGDIYVLFRERNVLAAGGAVGGDPRRGAPAYPVPDYATGGWIGGLIAANEKLLELANEETLIVPHAGPPQSRADLQAQLAMLRTMRERVESLMRKGKSAAEMIESGVTKDFDERYGDAGALFVKNVYEGLWWAGRLTNSL
jgi:glyoxylase-like metal-dependent hydrolase (beta-lactamase superfamily II)